MTKNCKSCRRDLSESLFAETYKTCDECRTKKKARSISLQDCKDFAESKGGSCLSTEYKNSNISMKWSCSESHEWETKFSHIKRGTWCRKCNASNQFGKLTIQDCHDAASANGGYCLSTEYRNNTTQMKWKCSQGHIWETSISIIRYDKCWCPQCSGNVQLSLQNCQELAESKGGKCLSTEYNNNNTRMMWQCSEKHEWMTTRGSIQSGSWCSQCGGYKSEETCRDIFENNLLEKFPKKRPKWLEGLELDGYNKELNIAFEYNGIQHYEYNERFHNGDPANLEHQKARDRKKYKLCRDHGVKLIIIPYQYDFRQPAELEDFILSELWEIV